MLVFLPEGENCFLVPEFGL